MSGTVSGRGEREQSDLLSPPGKREARRDLEDAVARHTQTLDLAPRSVGDLDEAVRYLRNGKLGSNQGLPTAQRF